MEEEEEGEREGREPRWKGGQLFSGLRSVISSFRSRGGEKEEEEGEEEEAEEKRLID